jgi:hypothetical protein
MRNGCEENEPMARKLRTDRLDHAISDLAADQDAVFALWQLVDAGLGRRGAQERVSKGRLHRVHKGVYSVVDPRLVPPRGRRRAALIAYGPEAALVHPSAGEHLGIRPYSGSAIHISVPGRRPRSRPGVRAHSGEVFGEQDIEEADGLRCTSVARTLLAIAAHTDEQGLRAAVRRAEILRIFDGFALDELLVRATHHPGAPLLRRVHGDPRTDNTESPLEDQCMEFCRRYGFEEPDTNVWLMLEGKQIRADFLWRKQRVVLETDGWETHGTRTAFGNDRRRDQLLLRNGFTPIRATADHLDEQLARTLRAVL